MSDPVSEAVAAFMRSLEPRPLSLCVAVSGGSDSVALVHIIARLRESLGIERVGVAHVNHGLRGVQADREELFVAALAGRLGFSFHVARLSGKSFLDSGIEAWARDQRYLFFNQVRQKENYDWVATAHTADDQAETVLMRLMRGTGFKGLAGIAAVRADGIIRPLLGVRKQLLLNWLADNDIAFREDLSNADLRFTRNRVRHDILPAMARREPEIVDRILATAESAHNAWVVLQPAIEKWILSNTVSAEPGRLVFLRDGIEGGALDTESLCESLRRYGIPFERSHIRTLIGMRLITEEKTVLLPAGWRALVKRETIEVTRNPGRTLSPMHSCGLAVPGETRCPDGATIRIETVTRPSSLDFREDARSTALIAADDATCRRLTYRSCAPDEPFWPIGWTGPVPVNRFLKNQKVPKEVRRNIRAVATHSGSIVWIPGIRLSEAFKVEKESSKILRLTYDPPSGPL